MGCLNKMKKPFSSDDRRMRYVESEKTAKKKRKIYQFNFILQLKWLAKVNFPLQANFILFCFFCSSLIEGALAIIRFLCISFLHI